MKSLSPKCLWMIFTFGLLIAFNANVWGQESSDPMSFQLNRPVHFLSPEGTNILLRTGTYSVASYDQGLQLTPATGNAFLIGAAPSTHEEEVESPIVVSLEGQEGEFSDMHMVMLLLPGGQSWEAAGSYSGVRERALRFKRISKFKRRSKSRIRRTIRRYRPSRRTPRPITVKGNRLSGLWIFEESVSKFKSATKSRGKWIWPGVYDVSPKLTHVTWVLDQPTSTIKKIIAKQGYGFELRLNQKLLKQGPDGQSGDFYAYLIGGENDGQKTCPQSKMCLGTTISYLQWDNVQPPWTLELTYWRHQIKATAGKRSYLRMPGSHEPLVREKPPAKTKVTGVIYPNATSGKSYFTHKVYPIFKHERCVSCHTLGSKSMLMERHGGLLSENDIQEVEGHVGKNYACGGGCHVVVPETTQPVNGVQFYDTEWKTPNFDIGIDWRGKSAQYICQKVKSTLPTLEKKRKHLFHDSRIAWAVVSGKVPLGRPTLPTVPPGDYFKFRNLLELWIRSGSPCPK